MTYINDYVSTEKPTHNEYEFCVGVDLNAKRLDRLVELLPQMKSVSISTLMHTPDMDQFCHEMLRMWGDYVNIEVWLNDTEEGLNLLNLLDVKPDFFRVAP